MSRSTSLPIMVLGFVAVLLIVVGCSTRTDTAGTPSKVAVKPKRSVENPEAGDSGKLFAHWPEAGLEGALLITGEQNGYLEPCGCTAGQRGGLARRLDLVDKLRKQGWNLALVDLGSLINDPNLHGGPVETRIRYTYALKALDLIGYTAVALSPTDLKLGVAEVVTQYMNTLGETMRVVSANVRPDESLGLEKSMVPVVRTETGSIKLGITSVIEPTSFEMLNDPDKDLMLRVKRVEEVLPEVLADLERDTQVQVLLVQGSPEYAREVAAKYPGFEVVVATSAFVEAPLEPEELNGGKTRLISVGQKGQYVGVLGLYSTPEQKYRYQRVDLNQRYNSKTEAMRKLVDEDFQEALKQANVLESYPRRAYVFANNAPSDASFVGAQTCKNCHPKTFEKWASTGHANAYEALVLNPKRNREFDAQCVSCHTTGFEYLGGFTSQDQTPHLKGNQCENCHGPGSKHVAAPDDAVFRVAMHRDKMDFDKNQRCVQCHSEDDSPHFDFATYWPKVNHNDLDDYTDPKVHRGLNPEQVARARQERTAGE